MYIGSYHTNNDNNATNNNDNNNNNDNHSIGFPYSASRRSRRASITPPIL